MSYQRSLEQDRAKNAWSRIEYVRGQNYAKEYSSLARSAAADIQTNGLAQTLAFWRAKGFENGKAKDGENAHSRLLMDVDNWVTGRLRIQSEIASDLQELDLLGWIIEKARTDQYRLAVTEAIAYLIWLKRFAEAELGE